ncbi:MAG: hypothetical protein E7388_02485 [Ruminococcaceae bacterium]|nr:hypothetical protein [Oscillospiraceae bacterium]
MKIKNIKINKFGCHTNLNLNFTDGVNVIKGNNESGKSTLLAFVRAVLYGFDSRSSDNPRKKFLPWGSNPEDRFGGEITFSHMGKIYRAVAVFTQSKKTDVITLYNDVTGEIIPLPDGNTIGEYILGLTAGAFDCSVFAAQLDSKADFTKDKTGLLFTKLSSVSNDSTESSQEANRRLKKAIHQITNRSGEGVLDKLYKKLEKLKATLNVIDNNQAHIGDLSNELEQLTENEEKLEKRRAYYLQFGEIKRAFGILETRKVILRKIKEIEDIDQDIESVKSTMDPSLYDDLKPTKSGLFVFLFILTLLLFGTGIFASVYMFLERRPFLHLIIAGVVTLLFLLFSIICLLKINVAPTIPTDTEENFHQLEYLKYKKAVAEEELVDLKAGATMEELEEKWTVTAKSLQDPKLNQDTLKYIMQCPPELIEEKLEAVTKELMETQQRISYVKGTRDSITTLQLTPEANSDLDDCDNIYQAISEVESRISTYKNKLDALYLAQNVLEISTTEMQNTFGPVINKYTHDYLLEMTGKEYGTIRIASDFQVSIYDETNMMSHSGNDYSGATEDQIYLAMRFALASLLDSDKDTLPLYLDDPFVQYDDTRYNTTLEFINNFTKKNNTQVLFATCQNRDLSPLQDYNFLVL